MRNTTSKIIQVDVTLLEHNDVPQAEQKPESISRMAYAKFSLIQQ